MPRGDFPTTTDRILVVSSHPLLREGLKLIIEEATSATVTTADNEVSAVYLASELTPSVIVIDHSDTKASNLDSLFQHQGYPVRVVVIGRNDNMIAVYSRSKLRTATLQNFIKLIRESK